MNVYNLLNIPFQLKSIYNSFTELILCSEHFLIWIPFIDFENTECSNKRKINNDARIQIKKVLEHIENIFKNINIIKSSVNNYNHNHNHNLEKIKWVLEGTMKDYERMYEENAEFYNNLANSYEILNDKCKNNKDKEYNEYNKYNENEKNNYLQISLEDLVILENNIELCENISDVLSVFSDSEYKLLNQIESGYMKSLLYDLIENIRIYKIKSLLYMM